MTSENRKVRLRVLWGTKWFILYTLCMVGLSVLAVVKTVHEQRLVTKSMQRNIETMTCTENRTWKELRVLRQEMRKIADNNMRGFYAAAQQELSRVSGKTKG